MALPNTQHTLEKLELLLKALHYKVRFEKGTFKTGACILESHNILVVNKFSNLESKIQALAEFIQTTDKAEDTDLDEKQKAFLYILKQTKLKF